MSDLPADTDAERYLLASMMTGGPEATEAAVELVAPEDFYRPAHQVIYHAMIAMFAAGVRADPVTLRSWIDGDGDMRALGGAHGGEYLMDLFGLPVAGSTSHYAQLVRTVAMRRQAIEECRRTEQALMLPSEDPEAVMGHVDRWLDQLHHVRIGGRPVRNRGYQSVTETVAKERDAVIPGLLDAQERVVVVAGEGAGKTTLAHQIGFAAAAGTHPFGTAQYEPQRVMIWDFENPELLLARRFRKLGDVAARYPGWDEANIRFELRPGGITSSRDVFELRDAARQFRPHLLVAGPVYKMIIASNGNADGNMLAVHARLAAFFDQIREQYGTTIWLEAHAPYGGPGAREMRPEGSNLWAKWPEFGLSLVKATKAHGGLNGGLEVQQFKGHREEGRAWPSWITRNPHGGWPWVANYAPGVLPDPGE